MFAGQVLRSFEGIKRSDQTNQKDHEGEDRKNDHAPGNNWLIRWPLESEFGHFAAVWACHARSDGVDQEQDGAAAMLTRTLYTLLQHSKDTDRGRGFPARGMW